MSIEVGVVCARCGQPCHYPNVRVTNIKLPKEQQPGKHFKYVHYKCPKKYPVKKMLLEAVFGKGKIR